MAARPQRPLEVRLYSACVSTCPPAFRREYAAEMVCDFSDAMEEASAAGAAALWRLRLLIALDLVRTFAVQWTRTGWPVIGVLSLVAPLVLVEVLAAVARRATFVIPDDQVQSEAIGVVLLAAISVFLIATTIALTLWAAPPVRRSRR